MDKECTVDGWMDWWGGLLGVVGWGLYMCNKSVG